MAMAKKKPASPIKDRRKVLDIQDLLREQCERNYILFVLGITTGYRTGDLVELRVRDIRRALNHGYFEIMENKKANDKNISEINRKPRVVKVIDNLADTLERYIENMKGYEFAFPSRKMNGHIQVASFSKILKEAGEYFGLKNISAHSMRKTYAHRIYVKSGFNITLVKEMLGHSYIQETKDYLGLDREMYDEYSDSLNDLINI